MVPSSSYLSLDRMTDSNVSLHCKGCEEEGRGVHGEELAVDYEGAAHPPPHPHVPQDMVGQNLLW